MVQSAYQPLFLDLDDLLASTAQWWQLGAFQSRDLPWQESQPELVDRLLSLDERQLLALEADPGQLARWLAPWVGEVEKLLSLSQLPRLPQRRLDLPDRLDVGIKGRKWAQIQNFTASMAAASGTVLEWCAGKGHLGRLLAAVDGAEVTSLEWQQNLCAAGQQQALRFRARQRFIHADARSDVAISEIGRHHRVLALHACGSLHTDLIKHWAASESGALVLAPCCYHLVSEEQYLPLSHAAQSAQVRLSKRCLSLPTQAMVTTGARGHRQRQQELLWRLAFDEWQREVRAIDEYMPLPHFPKRLLSGPFSDFVSWAITRKGLAVESMSNEAEWLQRGERRVGQVRLIELVMHAFRRPIEMWLILDRVLFLQSQGARVSLGEFCDYAASPRNILISAER